MYLTEASQHSQSRSWEAHLDLKFAPQKNRTVLLWCKHLGPLRVQRPFYPEGGVCHVYLLHPPGGLVAGDKLEINIQSQSGSHALLTTPAAGKVYRSKGPQAEQQVRIEVNAGAVFEYLPQENIVFESAQLHSNVEIHLNADAVLLAWEMTVFGRPEAQEAFEQGQAVLRWQLFREQKPLWLERMQLDSLAFKSPWGLAGHPVCGTFVLTPVNRDALEIARQLIADHPGRAVTLIGDVLICRARETKIESLREFFIRLWSKLRPLAVGKAASIPRVWAT